MLAVNKTLNREPYAPNVEDEGPGLFASPEALIGLVVCIGLWTVFAGQLLGWW